MKCARCGGDARDGFADQTVKVAGGNLFLRKIPCFRCTVCGEVFYSDDIAKNIEIIAEEVELYSIKYIEVDYEDIAEIVL